MKNGAVREGAGLSLACGVRLLGKLKLGKGMVMKELIKMVDRLIGDGDGEIGSERGGRCIQNVDGNGGTAEAWAGKGMALGDEENCIAGAGGSSADGDWLTGQLTKVGGGVFERTPGRWGGGIGRFAGTGGGCSVWAPVKG